MRGQMKSAVFWFTPSVPQNSSPADYTAMFETVFETPYHPIRRKVGYVRTEIIEGDDQAALDHAIKNARPGETVLNSVLLEE